MSQREDAWEWVQFQWEYLLTFLGGEARVEELAYETGAFTRRRKIDRPSDLLRLILLWAIGERSLMETAALAAEGDLADVSDVALLGRFRRAERWLGALLTEVLLDREPWDVAFPIRILDATCVSCRGSRTTERRIHLSLDLKTNRTTHVEVTDARGGERLDRFEFSPREIVIADRVYATRKGLTKVERSGAYFLIRMPWSNLPLMTPDGQPFDLFAGLRELPEARAGEFDVRYQTSDGESGAARLVAIRKSEPAAAAARKRIVGDAKRHGHPAIDVRTLEAAGYVMVITNVPAELSADSVLELYRLRWQIEQKFKTFKSVLHLDNVPTRSGELLNVYLLAKVLVALLIEDFIEKAESFSPWGYKIPPRSRVAPDPAPS